MFYFRGLGGNYPNTFYVSCIAGVFLTVIVNTVQTWYLGQWAAQYDTHDASEVAVFQ